MKSGTTALFEYLADHPDMRMPETKELHYYDKLRYQGVSKKEYVLKFPKREDDLVSGEATPFYLRHPHIPKWVKEDFPGIRVIMILRNPSDRAYSHYQQRKSIGKETGSLLSAIELEKTSMDLEWKTFIEDETYSGDKAIQLSYLSRGRYLEQIQNWLKYIPRKRMLILFNEDLEKNQVRELNKISDFLKISKFPDDYNKHKVNERKYPEMDSETRQVLDDYFKPYNQELFEFLSMPSPWDA